MTQAGLELKFGHAKIIDVALKYGYQSPEAFSRAFKGMYGIMPIAARNKDIELKAYSKITFGHSFNGCVELDYRIVHKEAYNLCGIVSDISVSGEQKNHIITSFWNRTIDDGTLGQFHRDIGLSEDTCLNAALFNFRKDAFTYMICYEAPNHVPSTRYFSLYVPSAIWAVFSTPLHKSEENTEYIQSVRDRIFLEWLPSSGYVHARTPELEFFTREDDNFVNEIWVPITKAV